VGPSLSAWRNATKSRAVPRLLNCGDDDMPIVVFDAPKVEASHFLTAPFYGPESRLALLNFNLY
jgi:hypothetical protein